MPVYLDHNATTPLDPRVLEAMGPYLSGPYGNPSSVHRYGRAARAAMDTARAQLASLVGAQPSEIVFTGGGTEANNLALKGVAGRFGSGHMLVSPVEHPCVLEPAAQLRAAGWAVDFLPVDGHGRVDPAALPLRQDTRLVSVMLANNETGVIQDVAGIVAAAGKVIVHTDAVQALGKLPVSFPTLGVQLMTLSAHKIMGPRGIGALVVDRRLDIAPLITGGGQEKGRRAGTENVAAIVGFGVAAELAAAEQQTRAAHCQQLRDDLQQSLSALDGVTLIATEVPRLPNTLQLAVPGIASETLLLELDRHGVAVSSGSACHSGSGEPSHVLLAMGLPQAVAEAAIRVSFGPTNTAADVEQFLGALQKVMSLRRSV